jgi:hypothetical protein
MSRLKSDSIATHSCYKFSFDFSSLLILSIPTTITATIATATIESIPKTNDVISMISKI